MSRYDPGLYDDPEPALRVKLTHPNAQLPKCMTDGAAGYDIAAVEQVVVPSGQRRPIATGLCLAIPPGCYGRLASRSKLSLTKSIDVVQCVLDSDYRGGVLVLLENRGTEPFLVNVGDRIAQLIIEHIAKPLVLQVDALDETARGTNGLGSTGA